MATAVATLAAKPYFLEAGPDDTPIYYSAAEFRLMLSAIWSRPAS